jgi:hypothetical protein
MGVACRRAFGKAVQPIEVGNLDADERERVDYSSLNETELVVLETLMSKALGKPAIHDDEVAELLRGDPLSMEGRYRRERGMPLEGPRLPPVADPGEKCTGS